MKIGVVGLGLIGGSLALASVSAGHNVVGTDTDQHNIDRAQDAGAISEVISLEDMTTQCDLIVLCVPSRTAAELVEAALSGTALVTDVSSVKKPICDAVADLEPSKRDRFLGGHPMAGSEQSGFDAARANLFAQKMWIIVPPDNTSLKNISPIENFVSSLGAEHCVLSPHQHDRLVAHISHLPHIASFALMDLAANESVENEIILRLAGGGFRDMTRIAASNKTIWLDIVKDNAPEITEALDTYISSLQEIRDDIAHSVLDNIESLITRAARARTSLPEAARRLEHLTEIHIPVPDTPGVLAEITALTKDVNVYDIKIVHALEEDRGVLSLVVQPDVAEGLISTFREHGFEAGMSDLAGTHES